MESLAGMFQGFGTGKGGKFLAIEKTGRHQFLKVDQNGVPGMGRERLVRRKVCMSGPQWQCLPHRDACLGQNIHKLPGSGAQLAGNAR